MSGTVFRFGERAVIELEPDGRPVFETFAPGSLVMPEDGAVVPLNRAHEASRLVGKVNSLHARGGDVVAECTVVDTVPEGFEAVELCRAGVLPCLSVEFRPIPESMRVETLPSGERLVTHRRVHLHGLSMVPAGAYRSASEDG